MAFMTPDYYFGKMWICEDCNSDQCIFPWIDLDGVEAEEMCGGAGAGVELSEVAWWARLSASGYMDTTEWSGPFKTEIQAREGVMDQWDVDPDSGDEFDPSPQAMARAKTQPLTDDGFEERSLAHAQRHLQRRVRGAAHGPTTTPDPKSRAERVTDFFFPPVKGDKDSFLSGIFQAQHRRNRRRR